MRRHVQRVWARPVPRFPWQRRELFLGRSSAATTFLSCSDWIWLKAACPMPSCLALQVPRASLRRNREGQEACEWYRMPVLTEMRRIRRNGRAQVASGFPPPLERRRSRHSHLQASQSRVRQAVVIPALKPLSKAVRDDSPATQRNALHKRWSAHLGIVPERRATLK